LTGRRHDCLPYLAQRWVKMVGDFAEFYATRKDAVLRAVVATTGDRTGAEDAVAGAFTRAVARLAEHPSPTAWVIRTALNVYRSWWRRLRRERTTDEIPAAAETGGYEVDGGSGSDSNLDVRRLVANLPTRQREVLALRVLADLPAHEVGAMLGIEPATVHVHLHRALAALRRNMLPAQPIAAEHKSGAALGEL
jgi:RNA polymerase sigma factor (sigma-70 family)